MESGRLDDLGQEAAGVQAVTPSLVARRGVGSGWLCEPGDHSRETAQVIEALGQRRMDDAVVDVVVDMHEAIARLR
jgi:hypothetical protein